MEIGQLVLVLIALVAANLPFVTERIFFIVSPPVLKADDKAQGERADKEAQKKHLGWRLLELVVFYFLVGAAAHLLESRLGTPHPQRWEFYAITACLFLVFAYPGFVVKYLWNSRGR